MYKYCSYQYNHALFSPFSTILLVVRVLQSSYALDWTDAVKINLFVEFLVNCSMVDRSHVRHLKLL